MKNPNKDISEQLLKSYKVLEDVRAKLENVDSDICSNELFDEYHSDLSLNIENWLGQIHALDCDMLEFVTDDE